MPGMEDLGEGTLGDLVAAWSRGEGQGYYAVGADVAGGCPTLLDHVHLLEYIQEDALWAESATVSPNLNLGLAGTGTGMHADAYPFWVQMLAGETNFRVVTSPEAAQHLPGYWVPDLLHQPGQPFQQLDLFDARVLSKHLPGEDVWVATLQAGDWLYLPPRAPRAHHNSANAITLSANFLDPDHANATMAHFQHSRERACPPETWQDPNALGALCTET